MCAHCANNNLFHIYKIVRAIKPGLHKSKLRPNTRITTEPWGLFEPFFFFFRSLDFHFVGSICPVAIGFKITLYNNSFWLDSFVCWTDDIRFGVNRFVRIYLCVIISHMCHVILVEPRNIHHLSSFLPLFWCYLKNELRSNAKWLPNDECFCMPLFLQLSLDSFTVTVRDIYGVKVEIYIFVSIEVVSWQALPPPPIPFTLTIVSKNLSLLIAFVFVISPNKSVCKASLNVCWF